MNLKLDDTGDIDHTGAMLNMVTRGEAVAQNCQTKLLTWARESPYDRDLGVPWLESVFGRQPFEGVVLIIDEQLRSVPGVDEVRNLAETLTFDNQTRVLTMSPTVIVDDEPINFSLDIAEV